MAICNGWKEYLALQTTFFEIPYSKFVEPLKSMEELKLINRCIANDRLAQKELYELHKNSMYTLAYRITSNFELSEDVLQEGFIKVFRNLKDLEDHSKLDSWIYKIIIRTAYARVKDRIKFKNLIKEMGEDEIQVNITYPSDVEYLEKAIQDLPDGYRTVFTLYEIEGYKHREIAELLDISVNTSKTQLRSAKLVLRKSLTNQTIHD